MNPYRRCGLTWMTALALSITATCSDNQNSSGASTDSGNTDGSGADANGVDGSGNAGVDVAATPVKKLVYAPCTEATHVGGFRISLAEKFTGVEGHVLNGVVPLKVPELVQAEGTCRLLSWPSAYCSPGCQPGEACKGDGKGGGTCIVHPLKHSVGKVTVTGLKAALSMKAKWGNNYINPGSLPHPAFDSGDPITLKASGGEFEAFTLLGQGVAALKQSAGGAKIKLESGKALTVTWQAGSGASDANSPVRVHVELNINNHGNSSGWIACDGVDSGTFTIPEKLVSALFDLGVSGFPTVNLTRRSVDSTQISPGCVQLEVASELGLGIEVDGVISCTDNKSCPAGTTCGADLTCK